MLEGTLRIAPACYHILHIIPFSAGHERNFFVDEGLTGPDGGYGYELVRGGLVPFGLEKFGLGEAMKEKSIDISIDVLAATVFFHQKHPKGSDLRIIAGWRNQCEMLWVAQPEIKSLAALRGKRIGVIDFGDVPYRGLRPWLSEVGLDPERDVTWVRGCAPPKTPEALRSKHVDAAFMRNFEAEPLISDGYNVLLDVKTRYPRGRPERIIAATVDILERHPEKVVAFLRAMIHSYWYVRDQPRNFPHLFEMERRLRRTCEDPEERSERFSCPTPQFSEALPFPIDGLPTALDVVAQEEFDAGDIDAMPDIESVCRFEFVRRAFQDLSSRPEVQEEYQRVRAVVERLGY